MFIKVSRWIDGKYLADGKMLFPNVTNKSVPWISIILKRNFSNSLKQSLHTRLERVATTKPIPRWLCESATDKVTVEKSLDIEAAFSQRMEGGTAHRRLCRRIEGPERPAAISCIQDSICILYGEYRPQRPRISQGDFARFPFGGIPRMLTGKRVKMRG